MDSRRGSLSRISIALQRSFRRLKRDERRSSRGLSECAGQIIISAAFFCSFSLCEMK